MLTLVIGGSASGKSEYAESLILASPARPRYYLATMEVYDGESRARVARHRAMRAEKEFETIECPVNLSALTLPRPGAVLLEDLGNLAANELYSPRGAGAGALDAILQGVDRLLEQCSDLVVVSNELFTGGSSYAGDTEAYLRLMADAHLALAKKADRVCEVVCGIAQY
ncbi:MAG: bifunctional adenosylcobinamide kinase/adenosylcobinamide-phosphate guanylyltransferase [Eubacteriales bacterium]|nr:bifunctional adenosylcobinamide kinase/adenosylcobinamide-phosphate guanylyltransferase [Eubacteriales bacterium]